MLYFSTTNRSFDQSDLCLGFNRSVSVSRLDRFGNKRMEVQFVNLEQCRSISFDVAVAYVPTIVDFFLLFTKIMRARQRYYGHKGDLNQGVLKRPLEPTKRKKLLITSNSREYRKIVLPLFPIREICLKVCSEQPQQRILCIMHLFFGYHLNKFVFTLLHL